MTDNKNKYETLFEQYAQWLENWLIKQSLPWLRCHKRPILLGLIATGIVGALLSFLLPILRNSHPTNVLQKLKEQVIGLERKLQVLEEQQQGFRTQFDLLQNIYYQGRIPLLCLELNDRKMSLADTKLFWIKENTLKLSRLYFLGAEQTQEILASHNLFCRYRINQGTQQEVIGIGETVVIPLPAGNDRFSLEFFEIRFTSQQQKQFHGFAYFTVYLDKEVPQLDVVLNPTRLDIHVVEKQSGILKLQVDMDNGRSIIVAEPKTYAPFRWSKSLEGEEFQLDEKYWHDWQRLTVLVEDVAGNTKQRVFKRLPSLRIEQKSGMSCGVPVVLRVTADPQLSSHAQVHLYLERLLNGQFVFYRETVLGPLSLPEGSYRARVFVKEEGERGVDSEAVVFHVDTSPPQGHLILAQDKQTLLWKLSTPEDKINCWTTVEWQGRFLVLKSTQREGQCELPADFGRLSVQATLRDEAGNETVLTKSWPEAK